MPHKGRDIEAKKAGYFKLDTRFFYSERLNRLHHGSVVLHLAFLSIKNSLKDLFRRKNHTCIMLIWL